jgi:hypothetical protein
VDERQVSEQLRSGWSVPDASFDALLSDPARAASRRFWTPVDVARLAAAWLEDADAERVLDVGLASASSVWWQRSRAE